MAAEDFYLVRPARGDYIHRSTCRHATALGVVRWKWADNNPDEDWKRTAPWLKACKRCDPPSPFRPRPTTTPEGQ